MSILEAIENNDLNLFKRLYIANNKPLNFEMTNIILELNRLDMWREVCLLGLKKNRDICLACLHGNYEAFNIMLEYDDYIDMGMISSAAQGGNYDILNHFKERGIFEMARNMSYGTYLVGIIAKYSQPDVVNYFIGEGFTKYREGAVFKLESENSKRSKEVLTILHDRCTGYDWGCEENICYICESKKIYMLEDSWLMDSYEYDCFIQWMPKEVLEDVISLF